MASTAPVDVTIDFRRQLQPFEGWGTSLAWWANRAGGWPEESLDRLIHGITHPREGLGLNVFRYNIGGGEQPGHAHMRPWGDVPGFKASADAPYDWTADERQRRVLLKLIRATQGRAIVEAFSNSPPWWMTISGCAAGSTDGGPNLDRANEQAFVDYLADVARFYRDAHAVTFHSLDPFNEPDAKWWKSTNNQEGLHVPRDQQARLIRLMRASLDARQLTQTIVSATDANSIDDALESVRSFDEPTLAALGQVNVHSYKGEQHLAMRNEAARLGKPLWQSESGPLSVGGTEFEQVLLMAERIIIDTNRLRPRVWCTWQIIDGGAWGHFHAEKDEQDCRPAKIFHMFATFTRAVRPGDRFVDLDSDAVAASVSSTTGEGSLFLINRGKEPRSFTIRLAGAQGLPAEATAIALTATEHFKPAPPIAIKDETITTTVPPETFLRLTVPAVIRGSGT